MDWRAAADALMRRKFLEDMYGRMTPEERQLFAQAAMQRQDTGEILSALQRQSAQMEDLRRRQQTFGQDFLSNVAGNAAWDCAVWLARRLLR